MNDIRNNRIVTVAAAFIIVALSFIVLKELQAILLPFFVAIIISFLFEPFYEWMKRKRVPSFAAIIVVVIAIIILSNIISVFVYTSINSFRDEIPKYTQKSVLLVDNFVNYLVSIGVSSQSLKENLDVTKIFTGEKFATMLTDLISGVAGIFTNFVLILIYVIFLLSEFSNIKRRVIKAFSKERSRKITETLTDIFRDVRKYIVGKTLINFAHALSITIIFWIFGLDFALIWGVLTFLLVYIPNIGAFVATLLPFLTALIQYDNILTPIILLIIMMVMGSVFGSLIEPKVLGDRLNLSPILLLFSLIFWGYIWGIVGMILSVPVMSMIKIVLSKFESTCPLAILMSHDVSRKNNPEQKEIEFDKK